MRRPAGEASVGPEHFRAAARHFASGVTVVAAMHGGVSHAITATAFCSLSLEPALVLVAVRTGGRLLPLVEGSHAFGISVLADQQRHVGEWAALRREPEQDLPLLASVTAVTGSPLVPDALAWFDCRLESTAVHGDHTLLIGRVLAASGDEHLEPLLYFRGEYRRIGGRAHLPSDEPDRR